MKKVFVCLIVVAGFLFCSCEKDNEYQFEATVLGKGLDCGETFLIDLTNISGNAEIMDNTYYADNLPSDLKINGLKIKLNCRFLKTDETYACTTMGITWSHVFVIEAERAE